MRRLYLMVLLLCAFVVQVVAQRTITGTVVDDTNMGVPGVNVVVKGTTLGTATDIDGNYTIKVPENAKTLVFSFLGYTTSEQEIGGNNSINVTLVEDAVGLDEVIVTALGISKRDKTIGSSIQAVKGDDLIKARESNLINTLSGKIAGVQINNSSGAVGSSSRIVVRGAASITGDSNPLFVVDGIPIDNTNYGTSDDGGGFDTPNGVADINPDDIENMTVLKGPAATALYGMRGANGVIEITTKKGKAGQKGLGITFNSSTTFERPLVLPDFQNSYGQGPDPTFFEWIDGQNDDGGVDESWGPPLDAGLSFTQWNSYTVDGKPLPWVSVPDNIKDFYETGVTTSNNLSVSGANEYVGYRLSLGLSDQKGMVPNTDYKKYNFTVGADANVTSRLKIGFSANYIKALSGNLPTGGYSNENPVQQMIWSGRNVDFSLLKDYENLPLAAAGTAAAGTPINWNTVFQNNPYWALHNNLNKLDKDHLIGNINLRYIINDYLSITAKTGTDFWTSIMTEQKAKGSNEFKEGYYREIHRRYTENNSNIMLTYDRRVTPDFNLTLNIGGNMMRQKLSRIVGEAGQLELPGIYNLSNVKSGTTAVLTNKRTDEAINSIFGSAQFGFRDLIFLDITGRNDWASVLPIENNSFFYPSVSLSGILTDLFNIKSDVLSFWKVRASWAKAGSKGILEPYKLIQTYSFREDPWGSTLLPYNPSDLNNPNLFSETTVSTEFGTDMRFFRNRLKVDFTYYDQGNQDLIVPVEVSAASGYIKAYQNVGETNNKGIELQLGVNVIKTKDLNFDITVNYARNKNKVVSLSGLESLILGGQWNVNLEAREGMPLGVLVGPAFKRDPNGNIIHENGIPQYDSEYKVLGNIQPDWTGGIGFDLGYKKWQLYTLIDAKMGGDIYSMTTTWGRYSGVLEETLLGREGGIVGEGVKNIGTASEPNYVANDVVVSAETYNKAAYSNAIAESSVFDASFVKLRQITLSYTLPNSWFKKRIFQGASLSLVGRNLAILYRNAPHIDPETSFSSDLSEQGQEFGQLPSARSIGFNVNFNF